MRDNPRIGAGRELLHPIPHSHGASVQAAHELLREVDADFARAAIYTLAAQYAPKSPKDRIRSLGYFDEPVLRQWAEHQAALSANATQAPGVIDLHARSRSRPSNAQQTYDTTLAALEGRVS